MKKARLAFHLCSLASLLLCIGTIRLSCAPGLHGHGITIGQRQFFVMRWQGRLAFTTADVVHPDPNNPGLVIYQNRRPHFYLPFWLPAAATILLPAAWCWHMRLRQWLLKGIGRSLSLPRDAGPTQLESIPPGLILAFGATWHFGLLCLCLINTTYLARDSVPDNKDHTGEAVGISLLATVLSFLVALIWASRLETRNSKRRASGLCVICGYDLRASEGRCPECGQPIPPPESPKRPDRAITRQQTALQRRVTAVVAAIASACFAAAAAILWTPFQTATHMTAEARLAAYIAAFGSLLCVLIAASMFAPKHPGKRKPPAAK